MSKFPLLESNWHSLREKIFSGIRDLKDLGVGSNDVPPEDFNVVGEAVGLLEGMAEAYPKGDLLPELVAAKMEEEILKTEFIAQHHVGRMIAHVACARGVSAKGDPGVAGVWCPCRSGRMFPEWSGCDWAPTG